MTRATSFILALMTGVSPVFAQIPFTTTLPLEKGTDGHTVAVSDAFEVYGLTYTPEGTVHVTWHEADEQFTVYGNVHVSQAGQDFLLYLGQVDTSYFLITGDSALTLFQPFVSDTFDIEGLPMVPDTNGTWYGFDSYENTYHIWGDVTLLLEDGPVGAGIGHHDNPGMTFTPLDVTEVMLHITEPVILKGLSSATTSGTNILLKRKSGDPAGTYYGTGQWDILIGEDFHIGILGNNLHPGLIIQNAAVDSIKMCVAGGGLLFGALPILDAFTLEFNHQKNQYAANGFFNIGVPFGGVARFFGARYTPSFQIDAGSGTEAGFLYNVNTKKFHVNDAVFSLKNVNGAAKVRLGGFELNDLSLGVVNDLPDSLHALITLPPGFSLEAGLGFQIRPDQPAEHRFTITSFDFDYRADTLSYAKPLGTTGFYVVELGGSASGFSVPKDIHVSAQVGLVYGEPFLVDVSKLHIPGLTGQKYVFIGYFREMMDISQKGIEFSSLADLGGLFSNGQWRAVLGSADVDVGINFGKSTTIDGTLTVFGAPLDFVTADMMLTIGGNGNVEGLGIVSLEIPNSIPIIGGKHLAHVEGAINHKPDPNEPSYAAGWFTIHLPFDKVHLGMKSDLKTGSISKIGVGAERDIVKQIHNDEEQQESADSTFTFYACNVNHNFELQMIKSAAYLQCELIMNNTSVYVDPLETGHPPVIANVHGPNYDPGVENIIPSDSTADVYNNHGGAISELDGIHIDVSRTDTVRWITYNAAAMSYTDIDWPDQPDLLLTPGSYYLAVNGWCPTEGQVLDENDYQFNVSPAYPKPTVALSTDGMGHVLIDYTAYLTDNTTITLYYSLVDSVQGKSLYAYTYTDGMPIGDSVHRISVAVDPGILTQEMIWVYARIDDHTNQPVYSDTLLPLYFQKRISGNVHEGEDSVIVVLQNVDSMGTHVVSEIFPSDSDPDAVVFQYYNVPPGHYQVHCFSHDTMYSFTHTSEIYNVGGNVNAHYQTPGWTYFDFTQPDWDNPLIEIDFTLTNDPIGIYGNIVDTAGNTVYSATVYLLNAQDSVLASCMQNDQGYAFFNLDTGYYYNIAAELPTGEPFHWDVTRTDRYFENATFNGMAQYLDSVRIGQDPVGIDFTAFDGDEGAFMRVLDQDGLPLPGTVIILRSINTSDYPDIVSVANAYGIAGFASEELEEFGTYNFDITWPEGYEASGVPSQFSYYGVSVTIPIFGALIDN